MAHKTEHVPLEFLWRIAKRRKKLSPEQVRHIRACHMCTYAVILCEVHRSIDKVQAVLESTPGSAITMSLGFSFGLLRFLFEV